MKGIVERIKSAAVRRLSAKPGVRNVPVCEAVPVDPETEVMINRAVFAANAACAEYVDWEEV